MKWKRLFLLAFAIFLVACSGDESILLPQDSYDLVTLTPLPTETPPPTEAPIKEDASGIGRAFYRAWEGQDYLGMYSVLSPQSQALVDSQSFVQLYEEIMETATVRTISSPLSSAVTTRSFSLARRAIKLSASSNPWAT